MRVWPVLGAALIALLPARHAAGQEMFVANIKLVDGATLRVNAPTYVYEESHTAPGYIIGPSVTELHGDMDHLPVATSYGTIFVPFHLIKAVTSARLAKDADQPTVTVALTDGSSVAGMLGLGSGYDYQLYMSRPHLAGQGGFGNIDVDLKKIAELSFTAVAPKSRTFKPFSQKPGGPYLVSADTATLKVDRFLGAARFDPRTNAFLPAKLDVAGVKFEPDFTVISRISTLVLSQGRANAEFVNTSGEKLYGPVATQSDGLLGQSRAGVVFLNLTRAVRIERQ